MNETTACHHGSKASEYAPSEPHEALAVLNLGLGGQPAYRVQVDKGMRCVREISRNMLGWLAYAIYEFPPNDRHSLRVSCII